MEKRYLDKSLSPAERARALLSQMTVREKIGQLTQRLYGFRCYARTGESVSLSEEIAHEVERFGGIGGIYGLFRADPWAEKDFETGLEGSLSIRTRNQIQEYVITHSRLGIPVLFSSECPHGHQGLDGYLLPVNLASACCFSPRLAEQAFSVCGEQMQQMGIDLALASVMEVLRDPRWGRCEESFGEDPRLAADMAGAVVRGLRHGGVGVVAKHFCAQGETTGGINGSAARIGERELREIHLPPARAAVEAGAEAVMATYHEIDGVYCCANRYLLTDVLREEFGFRGVIMSDALAVNCLDAMTGDTATSAALALSAGLDMGLLDDAVERLEEALTRKMITEEALDAAVLRVLELKFSRGLFEHPYVKESSVYQSYDRTRYPIVERLTEESIVLLKNTASLLPLDPTAVRRLGITGPAANDVYAQLGDYTPPIRHGSCTTLLAGVRDHLAAHAPTVSLVYSPFPMFDASEDCIPNTLAALSECETVIVALGGSSNRFGSTINSNGQVVRQTQMDCGEGVDVAALRLPGAQLSLLAELKASGKRIIAVLIGGRPYETEDIDNASDAFLCSFYPGPFGGTALAKLLFGTYAPAGRLPVSLPRRVGQLPVYYNHKRSYPAMKYADGEGKPRYAFGDGLTYTRFSYRALPEKEDANTVCIEITNVGERTAYAVPQLYLSRRTGAVTARERELVAYGKYLLSPGERKEVLLSIPEEAWMQYVTPQKRCAVKGHFSYCVCDCGECFLEGERTLSQAEAEHINRHKKERKTEETSP